MKVFPVIVITFLASFVYEAQAQQYYVVIGGFAVQNNAKKFTGYARSLRYDAHYDRNTKNNLFYVYVLKTTDRTAAFAQAKQFQRETKFTDTWVFEGVLGKETPVVQEPVVQEPTVQETPVVQEPVVEEAPAEEPIEEPVAPPAIPPSALPANLKGKAFKFIIQTADGQPVSGSVHHVDFTRARDLGTYPAGTYVDVLPPPTGNNPMTVVCGIFGYKEVVKLVDYSNPALTEGASQDEHGAWVITYPLERMKKGDVSVMYHVAFYKDAVVMLPNSKSEIDELVSMMKANQNYKIKIHGHCNGNNSRRIIALGKDKNYFDIKGSDERKGSAKELSRLRAEAIQSYLMDNGIEKKRAEIFAWGGSNMLVSETSTTAKLNDRIEIEILED